MLNQIFLINIKCRVEFEGEIGLDRGGLAKELLTIAVRDLINTSHVLSPCTNGRFYWFTNNDVGNKQAKIDTNSPKSYNCKLSAEFVLGLLASLAVYNGIYIDLPIPPSIYKILKNKEVS